MKVQYLVLCSGVAAAILSGCSESLPDVNPSNNTTLQKIPLQGLETSKSITLPVSVQAAYNNDTMFFQVSWQGDRGDSHDYLHYTNGQWQREGFHRRESQSTLDSDSRRGRTNATSTIWESRVTFFIDDPFGVNAVPGFGKFGCFLVCHDDSRFMPEWDASSDLTMYLPNDRPGKLDLWHHRLGRANPIGWSDDQYVTTKSLSNPLEGGRHGDAGTSPYQTNELVAGQPAYVLDPTTTGGKYAFKFGDAFTSPYRFFMAPGTTNALFTEPTNVARSIDFVNVSSSYKPQEGDAVPRRRLRTPTGSRGDISAINTTFTPTSANGLTGTIRSNVQRALNTFNDDDTQLTAGKVYNIAFAVNTGLITVRDHYVSFPMTISLGGGLADIQATYVVGSGKSTPPDFNDTVTYPVTQFDVFLPGITSYEFLTGANTTKTYIDPITGQAVDQSHGGTNGLMSQGLGCRDCHTVKTTDTFDTTKQLGINSGAMEIRVPARGGVHTPTPLPLF